MKRIIIFVLILLLLIPIFTKADDKNSDLDVLQDILYDLDGKPSEADIVFNGIIRDSFIGKDEMTYIGEELVSKLNLVGQEIDPFISQDREEGKFYAKMVIFERDYSQINYDGYDSKGNQISINLNSYKNKEIGLEETSLSISVVKEDDFSEINDIIKKIEKIYREFDSKRDLTSCLVGKIEGKYNKNDLLLNLEEVLKNTNGRIVEEFSDDDFLSYTIYSPLIEDYLTINEKKININLSIRYNKEEGYTYLWIASPIITMGY